MAKNENKIPNLSVEHVREHLSDARDPKAIRRLTAAHAYLTGLSPNDIEKKYGWPRQTVYNWLDRFEEREFEDALYDDERPGRPSKLSDDQFQQFAETLNQSPEKAGYDVAAWSGILAQQYLMSEFDIVHSRRHVQRLMKEAEGSFEKSRPEQASALHKTIADFDESR